MLYDVENPGEYLTALEDDWRKPVLLQIRDIIITKAPELDEGIEYKMLAYSGNGKTLFHLNAQKDYVSLYVGNIDKVDPEKQTLQGLSLGKGCIRFKKTTNPGKTNIDQFIERAVNLWRKGNDLDC